MKIFSSSPYAAFNPKEWSLLSKTNHKFSDTPIRIKKRNFGNFKYKKSTKIEQDNFDQPKQMQLSLTS